VRRSGQPPTKPGPSIAIGLIDLRLRRAAPRGGPGHVRGAHRPIRRGQNRRLRVASRCRVVDARYWLDLGRHRDPRVEGLVVRRRWRRDPVGRGCPRGQRRCDPDRHRPIGVLGELAGGQLLRSQLRDWLDRAPLQVNRTARVGQAGDRTMRAAELDRHRECRGCGRGQLLQPLR
jgi:hypothetical protein